MTPTDAFALLQRAAERMQEKDARESGRTCWNAIQLRELLHELAPYLAAEMKEAPPFEGAAREEGG